MKKERGSVALAAILFLAVFFVLAGAFMSQTMVSLNVSRNEGGAARAQAAAESGLELIKYAISGVSLQSSDAHAFQTLRDGVAGALGNSVGAVSGTSFGVGPLTVPQDGGTFLATVALQDASHVKITAIGSDGPASRTVAVTLNKQNDSTHTPFIFEFSMVTPGTVSADGAGGKVKVTEGNPPVDMNPDKLVISTASETAIDRSKNNAGDFLGKVWVLPGADTGNLPASQVRRLTQTPTMPTFNTSDFEAMSAGALSSAETTSLKANGFVQHGGWWVVDDWTRFVAGRSTVNGNVFFTWNGAWTSTQVQVGTEVKGKKTVPVYEERWAYQNVSSISLGGITINGSFVAKQTGDQKTIAIQNSDLALNGSDYGYALLAPSACLTYKNGSTNMTCQGNIVVSRAGYNAAGADCSPNNSTHMKVTDGSLFAMDASATAINLGQADWIFHHTGNGTSVPTTGVSGVDTNQVFVVNPGTYTE